MIKLNSDLTRGLDVFKNNISDAGFNQTNSQAPSAQSDIVHVSQSHQQSFTFFYRSVHSKLEQALDAKTSKLEQEIAEQKLAEQNDRAETAASNILNFVEHQLKQDVADGSTKAQLESRINAALEGFNQGYDEAEDALSSLQLLSPDLNSEISLTKEKVLAGIEQFKADYLGQEPAETDDVTSTPETQPAQASSNEAAFLAKQSAGLANDFTFELTTADGDKVTINASMIAAQSREAGGYSGNANGQQTQMAYLSQASYKESNFAFSVEGELDEKELEAINNLLNQVNDLAGDFYGGDVSKAFDKALELNYNSDEISEFSISLTQIKNFTAYQAYQTDKPIFNPNAISQLKPLADFTRDLVSVSQQVEDIFAHPRDLITDVMKQITQLREPIDYSAQKPSFDDFANKLLDTFSSHLTA